MGHVQDRWYRYEPDPNDPRKRVRIPTSRHGSGKRYKARLIGPDGDEVSQAFPDGQLKRAREWLSRQEADLASGDYVDPRNGKVTIEAFGRPWLTDLDTDEASREALEMRFESRIFPYLGKVEFGGLKPSRIRSWDRTLREAGLSDRYRHTLFTNLAALCTAAVDDGVISKSPFDGKSVKKPKPAQKKIVPWPEDRIWAVQDALPERFRVLVDEGAGLGLRQGECFGLSPDDIDRGRRVVRIVRQVKTVRHKHVFALPKYDKTREVPLSDAVLDALDAHMTKFPPVEITLPWDVPGGKPTTVRLIATSVRGLAIAANDFNRDYWKKALEACGVPHGRYENGMHDLRHFFASMLLDQGESIKAVAEWLGHADAAFTLGAYTHLMPSSDTRTKSVIESVYGRRDGHGPNTAHKAPGSK